MLKVNNLFMLKAVIQKILKHKTWIQPLGQILVSIGPDPPRHPNLDLDLMHP